MKNEPPYPRYKDPELQFTVSEVFDHLPANRQKIDLLLQLMKVTVVARAPGFIYFFLQSLHSMAVCRHASGRCCSLFSFLIFFFFCLFTFPGFPFTLIFQLTDVLMCITLENLNLFNHGSHFLYYCSYICNRSYMYQFKLVNILLECFYTQ